MEKKLDGNYTRRLRVILNKSWRQHLTKHQLNGHLPAIMKTIKVRRTRHAGHCWRSRDELISDVLLWTPSHGRAKAEEAHLCVDMGCSPEYLLEERDDREECDERGSEISVLMIQHDDDNAMSRKFLEVMSVLRQSSSDAETFDWVLWSEGMSRVKKEKSEFFAHSVSYPWAS